MLYDPKWEVEIESDVVRILRTAKNVISDPRHWTCGEYARTERGRPIGTECPAAIRFCSVGALAVASGTSVKVVEESAAYGFLRQAAMEQEFGDVHLLNDGGGHGKAMKMFDRAVELAAAGSPSSRESVTP